MDKTSSADTIDLDLPKQEQRPTTLSSNVKSRFKAFQKKWGPLMPAKEHLFDEYNFPAGRYAGQDDRNLSSQQR
ncbi:hypothetical protein N7492_002577 [Penicillium capsulatum]|uniref:Uncharacterized protein n=1 Tax=Penicillium capsulatum TaxID=69766 RepID=A0A9W9IKC9_9EURO|nr:hypothetical protein N7492_002577 [Penicillium capsulatum]